MQGHPTKLGGHHVLTELWRGGPATPLPPSPAQQVHSKGRDGNLSITFGGGNPFYGYLEAHLIWGEDFDKKWEISVVRRMASSFYSLQGVLGRPVLSSWPRPVLRVCR